MAAEKLNMTLPASLTAEFGVDPLRYYLLRETILGNDGEFSLESITARYNTDLANNLGNLVARVAAVVTSKCGGVGTSPSATSRLRETAERVLGDAQVAWEGFAPSTALEVTWELIGATNAYLEEHAPWKMEPGDELDTVMGDALEAIRLVAILITPAMPSVADEIWRRVGLEGSPGEGPFAERARWGLYRAGREVLKGPALFPRITETS